MVSHKVRLISPIRVAIGTVALLVIIQATILGVNGLRSQHPVLGVQLENQQVGTLYNNNFHAQVSTSVEAYETKNFMVRTAHKTSTVNLRQLGVKADAKQLYAALLAVGRTGNIFTRLAEQNAALAGSQTIHIGHHGFNDNLAREFIAARNQAIEITSVDAGFAYENQKSIIRPDRLGRTIDADAAISILRSVNPMATTQVVLPISYPSAALTEPMLTPLLPQVKAITQKPLSIEAGSSKVVLSPEELTAILVPKVALDAKDPHKIIAQISFDEAKLTAVVNDVVKRAVFAPKPTIMQGGRITQQGQSGLRAQDSNTLQYVLAALSQRQAGTAQPDTAYIPLVAVNPPIIQREITNPQLRTGTGQIRLTFDDGPSAYTEQILDVLGRYNVRATFYVIGRDVSRYPGTMQRIVREGHRIGNHSFSHSNLTRLSRAGVVQELRSTQEAIRATAGVTPTTFRPPQGAVNQTVREVASSMGVSIELWSVDPQDWTQPGAGAITQRVLQYDGPGSVILLHSLYRQTVDALPAIIEGIRAQGYRLE